MQRLRSAVKLVSSALASPQTVQWRCCFLPHNITPCNASLNLAKYVVLKIMLPPCLSLPLLKQIRGQKNEAHYINFHLLWCWCTQVLSKGKEGFPTSFPFMQSTGNYDKAKGLEALLWPQKEKKKQFTDAWHYMYAATWEKKRNTNEEWRFIWHRWTCTTTYHQSQGVTANRSLPWYIAGMANSWHLCFCTMTFGERTTCQAHILLESRQLLLHS